MSIGDVRRSIPQLYDLQEMCTRFRDRSSRCFFVEMAVVPAPTFGMLR